jgi:hypothetical protein
VLVEKFQGFVFPSGTRVVDIPEWEGEEDGRPHLYVDLVLSDPVEERWPTADRSAIRTMARVDGWTVSLAVSSASEPRYRQGRPSLTE